MKNRGGLFLFFCLGLIAGVALFSWHEHTASPQTIDYYIGQKVSFYGEIISEPTVKGKTVEVDVEVLQFSNKNQVEGKVRLRTTPWPRLAYGDKVLVVCQPEKPENSEFNYQRYLARYGIYALCFRAEVEKLGEGGGNPLKRKLYSIKNYSKKILERHIGEPESSLIGPVLFGGGDEIGKEILNDFRRSGLTHIMAVSGFNVAILAAGLGYVFFLCGLRRKLVFLFSALATAAYVILVGAPPSAVRAGIMSILVIYALAIGRLSRLLNVVIITAAGTLIFNPRLLAADIGWQLSFAAVLGLMYLHPIIKKGLDKILPKRLNMLGDIVAATLAAQLSTTPISLYHFGQISLISPLANILVVWTIPFLTAASAIALPIAALLPALGDILFLPSFFIAKYIIWIVSIMARPEWATFET